MGPLVNMNARRDWLDVVEALRDHRCQIRLPDPAKLLTTVNRERKKNISREKQI